MMYQSPRTNLLGCLHVKSKPQLLLWTAFDMFPWAHLHVVGTFFKQTYKACPPLFLILLFVTSPSLAHSPVFHFLNILPTDLRFPFHSWVLTSAMIFLSVCLPACCGIFRVLHETGLLTSPKEKYQDRLAHFTQRKISKSSRWRWFAYLILPIACQFNIFFKNSSNQGHKAFQNR